jgi:hypothetical protein
MCILLSCTYRSRAYSSSNKQPLDVHRDSTTADVVACIHKTHYGNAVYDVPVLLQVVVSYDAAAAAAATTAVERTHVLQTTRSLPNYNLPLCANEQLEVFKNKRIFKRTLRIHSTHTCLTVFQIKPTPLRKLLFMCIPCCPPLTQQ